MWMLCDTERLRTEKKKLQSDADYCILSESSDK